MDGKELDGSGIALDNFNPNNKQTPVLLPFLNQTNLLVPKYFVSQIFSKRLKEGQRKFKLFIPTTSTRNLSTRNKKKSIQVKRVNRDEIELIDGSITPPPKLSEFSKKDQTMLKEYFAELSTNPPLEEYSLAKSTPRARRPRKKKTPEPSPVEPEPIIEEPSPMPEPEPIIEPPVREQKKRGRKLKYATAEEAKLAQQQQKRDASKKLYATLTKERLKQKAIRKGTYAPNNMETQNYEGENEIQYSPMEGTGVFDSIKKVANKTVNKISKVGKQVAKFAEKVINPDAFMPPSVKDIINNHGQEIITSITLRRNPVSHLITGAMNAVSLGSFQKKLDQQPYDELFHLAMLVQTANTRFLLEKVERVNVSSSIGNPDGLETLACPLNGKEITVFDLINNTKEKMGKTKFLDYDPVSNNCQVFLMNVLDANGLLNAENKEWVKQDTEVLFKNNKVLAKVSKKLTDIGASVNVLMKGGEIKNTSENKIYPNNIKMELHYLLPQKQKLHQLQLSQDMSELPEALEAGLSVPVHHGKGIGKTFKKIGRQVNSVGNKVSNVVRKVDNTMKAVEDALDLMKDLPANARGELKKVGLDVAEILLKKGVPVTAGTIAGVLGTMAGGPALGIASSVGASYLTGLAANKIAEEEGVRGSSGSGLYAQNQGRGCGDSGDECCEMCGGKLFIDRKFSVRDIYNAGKSVPKVYNENMKSLKQGKDMEGRGYSGEEIEKMKRRQRNHNEYLNKQMSQKPTQEILNGVVAPKMGGYGLGKRPPKGSQEAKDYMKRLRDMRKKK